MTFPELANVQLSPIRWLVVTVLICTGLMNGFTRLSFSDHYKFLTSDAELDATLYDWIVLGEVIISIFSSFVFGVWAIYRPLNLKRWILLETVLLSICLAGLIAGLLQRTQMYVIFFAQVMGGLSNVIFISVVISISNTWFDEVEHTTVFFAGYTSVALGYGFAALVPFLLKTSLANGWENQGEIRSIYILICTACCIFTLSIAVVTWIFIPSLPEYPPSLVEAYRLRTILCDRALQFHEAVTKCFSDLRAVYSDRASVFLILSTSLGLNMFYQQFLLISVSPEDLNITDSVFAISPTEIQHVQMLAPVLGGAVGSIVIGLTLAKVNDYRVLSYVLGIFLLVFSIQMLIFYHIDLVAAFQIFIFLYGSMIISVVSFSGEILKRHVYPAISESTQGVGIVIVMQLILLLFTQIFPSFVSQHGLIWLYVFTSCLSTILCILLVTISPKMARTQYLPLTEETLPDYS